MSIFELKNMLERVRIRSIRKQGWNKKKVGLILIWGGLFGNYFVYPQLNTKFKVVFDKKDEFNIKIVQNCESIKNGNYRPNFLLNNRHIQSIYNINQKIREDLEFKI